MDIFHKHIVPAALLLCFSSCFTGVESTPKITAQDVKKEHISVSSEQRYLANIGPQAPSQWEKGKLFYVTDPKISIIFTSQSSPDKDNLYGQDIVYQDMYPVTSVTGEQVTEIEFLSPQGGHLFYRLNTPFEEIGQRQQLEVPFTIEHDVIDNVASIIQGKRFYSISPLWYSADGEQSVNGLRYVPVDIQKVLPGNSVYPIRIVFSTDEKEGLYSMYMTVGNQRNSTRNFDTLLAFDNPRLKYPLISNENWALIQKSRVALNMSRDECRLALGSPQSIRQLPTRGGLAEGWSYPDGILLLFDLDGYLIDFRR